MGRRTVTWRYQTIYVRGRKPGLHKADFSARFPNHSVSDRKIRKRGRTKKWTDKKEFQNLLKEPATASRRSITEPRKYARVAQKYGWVNADRSIWPISVDNLMRYSAFSYKKGNQPATIATYLSALSRHHTRQGFYKWRDETRLHPMI